MDKIIFSFDSLGSNDAPVVALKRMFKRAGVDVVQADVQRSIKRTSSISYRELTLTCADSQQVVFRVKQTGDIFQALVNGKVLALRYPDDHAKAVGEIVKAMDSGRAAYQKKMAAAKVVLPPSIRTAAPTMLKTLEQKRDALIEAIAATRAETAKIRGQAAPA